jgi:hypothetical protein
MASASPGPTDREADRLAAELDRRGLSAPAAILLDAHGPLLPLLRQGAIFLGPLLAPVIGFRRFAVLRRALDDPASYARLAGRLAGSDPGAGEVGEHAVRPAGER